MCCIGVSVVGRKRIDRSSEEPVEFNKIKKPQENENNYEICEWGKTISFFAKLDTENRYLRNVEAFVHWRRKCLEKQAIIQIKFD